jgi:hypothetical protein
LSFLVANSTAATDENVRKREEEKEA